MTAMTVTGIALQRTLDRLTVVDQETAVLEEIVIRLRGDDREGMVGRIERWSRRSLQVEEVLSVVEVEEVTLGDDGRRKEVVKKHRGPEALHGASEVRDRPTVPPH